MSDLGWCLVDLAAPPGEAESRADRVRHWLLYEQAVIPNPTRDDLWQPSELAPGPAWRLVVGEGVDDEFLRVADNGVDVDAGWAVHGKAGTSAPSCRGADPRSGSRSTASWWKRGTRAARSRRRPAPRVARRPN